MAEPMHHDEGETQRHWVVPTVLASAAATVAANAAVFIINDHEVPRWTYRDDRYNSVDEDIVGAGPARVALVDSGKYQNVIAERGLDGDVAAAWAEQFEADSHVGEFSDGDIGTITGVMDDLRAQGFTKIGLGLTGHTSAEDDDANDGFAGLSKVSDRNRLLAQKRAELLAPILEDYAQSVGLTIEYVKYGKPQEAIIDASDEFKIYERLQAQAQRFGYSDVEDMIERWNRAPQDAPPVVDTFLREVLTPERYVQVAVTLGQEKICDLPVRRIVTRDQGGDTDETRIFFPVLFPAFIRRRQKDKPTPTAVPPEKPERETQPIDETPVPPEEPEPPTPGRRGRGWRWLPPFMRAPRLPAPGMPEPTVPEFRPRLPRGCLPILLAGIGALGLWGWNKLEFDGKECYVDISKDRNAWLPDIDFHWNTCDVPTSDTTPTTPTVPPDPCMGLPRRERTVEEVKITQRNGEEINRKVAEVDSPAPVIVGESPNRPLPAETLPPENSSLPPQQLEP